MKIDVYSTMHNEELILPYWLRHYERFAERIFIWEDESTDQTRKILEAHPKVTLLPVEKHGIDDTYWVNHLWTRYKKLSRGMADWVMIVDADEFIYHPRLVEKLADWKQKNSGPQVAYCHGFLMMHHQFPFTDGQIYEEVNTGVYDALQSKRCIFTPDIYIRYRPGRHHVVKIQPDSIERIDKKMKLLHFKFLGEGYFMARCRRNMERMSKQNISYKYHYHNDIAGKKGHSLFWYRENKGRIHKVI